MRPGNRQRLCAAFEDAGATLIRTVRLHVIAATGVIMRPILMLGLMAIGHRAMRMTYVRIHRRNFHRVRRRKRCKSQRENYDDRDERAHCRHDQGTSAPHHEKLCFCVNSYAARLDNLRPQSPWRSFFVSRGVARPIFKNALSYRSQHCAQTGLNVLQSN